MESKNEKLVIVCQNLNQTYGKEDIQNYINYIKKYKLKQSNDFNLSYIYAFQEFLKVRPFETKILYENNNCKDIKIGKENNECARKLWEKFFPWMAFRSGYWQEVELDIEGLKVVLINIHISCRYFAQLCYVLLNRLEQLNKKNRHVILLGDFNAAFSTQTQQNIEENDKFLKLILKKGFIEVLSQDECTNPHYTFNHKGKWKKLDHIFMSHRLIQNIDCELQYIDINELRNKVGKEEMDHSGLILTITKKKVIGI